MSSNGSSQVFSPRGARQEDAAMLDRRRFLTCTIGGLLAHTASAPWASAAQATGAAPAAPVQSLGEGLSLLTSGGTNVLALATPEGLVLVDSGAPDRVDA